MEDGGWRMEDGGWRIEDGRWTIHNVGRWRMEDGGSILRNASWKIADGSMQRVLTLFSFVEGSETSGGRILAVQRI